MRPRDQPRGRRRIQARLASQFPEYEPSSEVGLFQVEPQMGRTEPTAVT